ncbi:C40 family peptidase [Chryseobacterium sp.]|uniref:C40 family peptidase n=1 Tax=Chryseobacterium sp. TaxID=1871047 RepID=UPI0011C9D182|nr:C40 family peptidase [Chryseobacterium sp.]TXF79447.1 NlpC/P60 family protein [Chryseobacterium sp.]
MKNIIIIMSAAILLVSCGASRKAVVKREVPTKTVKKTEDLRNLNAVYSEKMSAAVRNLIEDSEKYLGAPYKYAGNTSAGFDCSGFTEKVFAENKVQLPRRSADQANTGKEIEIRRAEPGDLLFFATSGGETVSHVGIVHDIGSDGEVKFIHASTSKGVIISSLNEKYWNKAYLFTRRVL